MPKPRNDPTHTDDTAPYILHGVILSGNNLVTLLPIWRGHRLDEYNGSLTGPHNQALVADEDYVLVFDLHRSELRLYEFDVPTIQPVRVQLEESLQGPVVDASISFTVFNRNEIDIDSEYVLGSRVEPTTALYKFFIDTVDQNGGLVDCTGETVLRRLSRIPADRSVVLAPRATPYTPQECVDAVLSTYNIPNNGTPNIMLMGADGPFALDIPAFVYFPPRAEEQREPESVLDLLRRCLAPFDGYYVRADENNVLTIVPPHWQSAPGPTLTNADVLAIDVGEIDPSTVVNRCTVRSQGYGFSNTLEEVMQPASFGLRGERGPALVVEHPTDADLVPLKLNDAPVVPAYSTGVTQNWPLQTQTVVNSDFIEVRADVALWVREFGFSTAYVDTYTHTTTVSLNGNLQRIVDRSFQFGALPKPPDAFGRVQVFAKWLAQDEAFAISWDVDLACNSFAFSSGITVWGVRVELRGDGYKFGQNSTAVTATFGDNPLQIEQIPGLAVSISRYGLRPKTIDSGIYQLTPEQALTIAQNQVERGLNPKRVFRVTQAANMVVRPWHLNTLVSIPAPTGNGVINGVVRSWRYVESHSTNGTIATSEFELEQVASVLGQLDTTNSYGEAVYGTSPYL